jgi:hypothetical protein
MSGPGHTPGPWHVSAETRDDYAPADQFQSVIFQRQTGLPICRLGGNRTRREQEHGDANLIAAAPDMAQALIRFVSMAHIYSQFNLPSYAADLANARAALAKAGL